MDLLIKQKSLFKVFAGAGTRPSVDVVGWGTLGLRLGRLEYNQTIC